MALEPYEVVRLLLAAIVAVPAWIYYGRLGYRPGRGAGVLALAALFASYLFNVLEVYFAPELMNTLQHLAYGVAGAAAAVTAIRLHSVLTAGGAAR